MQEEQGNKIGYKIEADRNYIVYRNEAGGYVFYKIQVQKKNYDGTKTKVYKNVAFKRGIDIPNATMIKIKKGFEDFRLNPNDKYNPIWSVFILDFEIVEQEEQVQNQAFDKYRNNLLNVENSGQEADPYSFMGEQVSVDDVYDDID